MSIDLLISYYLNEFYIIENAPQSGQILKRNYNSKIMSHSYCRIYATIFNIRTSLTVKLYMYHRKLPLVRILFEFYTGPIRVI